MSVLTHIDFCHAWAIFGPLVDKNTRKGELVELPASDTWGLSFIRIRSLPLKSFLDFFLNVVPYQLESWFIHWVGCTTYWVHVSLEWDPCDLHVLSLGTVKGCISLDPSKISKSGWWGLQLDAWQLCNSLWYGLINSKLHINKKVFFLYHTTSDGVTVQCFKSSSWPLRDGLDLWPQLIYTLSWESQHEEI